MISSAPGADSTTAPEISVIIVNLNGIGLLEACLDSLRKQTFANHEVILVDNASSDGSAEFVASRYPEVQVIPNAENLGFGVGNNIGFAHARGRYFALLNNDTVADPGWLSALAASVRRSAPSCGMWASKVLFHDAPDTIDTAGHLLYADGLNNGRGRGEKDHGQYDREEDVLFPSGCAALLSREMLDDIGGFDPDFFAYGDDAEIGLRGRLAGWTCTYVPSAVVYHKLSVTTGRYSPLKAFLVERNRIWILVKCFPLTYVLASPVPTAVRLYHHVVAARRRQGAAGRFTEGASLMSLVGVYLKANASALAGLPKTLAKRRRIMRARRVTTGQFCEWLRQYRITAREIAFRD